jgi:hypothetical protein
MAATMSWAILRLVSVLVSARVQGAFKVVGVFVSLFLRMDDARQLKSPGLSGGGKFPWNRDSARFLQKGFCFVHKARKRATTSTGTAAGDRMFTSGHCFITVVLYWGNENFF